MKIAKSTRLMLLVLMFSTNSFAQNTLKIQGATIDLNGGVILTLQNIDLDNDGTLDPAVGAGRILFKGANNNAIRGRGTTNFDELEIDKTSGGILTLQTEIDIRSGIWFSRGLINLGDKIVTLLGNAALNGESETSRITASNGGYIQVSMPLSGPRGVNPGNLGAIISSTRNLGLTTIRRGHAKQTIEAGRTSILRYFDIAPQNNTNLDATIRLHYSDAELDNQAEDAIEFRTSNDLINWAKLTATTRNATSNYIELGNINSFSRITLADDGAGLPVTFTSFTAACNDNEVLVKWVTASEENSKHFEVERSANGMAWTTIATLQAAGNSSIEKRYSYTDQQPQGKFYRIKEVDLDGKKQYTQVVVADCAPGNTFKMWPNPVQEKLFVTIKAERLGSVDIKIFNSEGKLVKKQHNGLLPGTNQLTLDMHTLSIGYYHVEVVGNDGLRKALTVFKK